MRNHKTHDKRLIIYSGNIINTTTTTYDDDGYNRWMDIWFNCLNLGREEAQTVA